MQVLVPIFICVVLPVSIVLIYFLNEMNKDNKRTEVLLKAIESNNNIDTDKLTEALHDGIQKKTPLEVLDLRLLRGCIFSLIGVALLTIGLVNYVTGADFSDDPVTVPLLLSGASLAVGISYLIVYFVSRKQLSVKNND